MTSNKGTVKKKFANNRLGFLVIFFALIGIASTAFIGYRASLSAQKLFSISLVAFFAGLLFESFRINDNWKTVIYSFIGAYFFSLFNFLPYKQEHHYNLEHHIEVWPYCFMFFFAMATIAFEEKKVTAKLTEGVTLMQSISIIYWVIDYGFINIDTWYAKVLLGIALLFSVFSIISALTYFELTTTSRLTLSIWSTIIMVLFAIDNIYRVLQNEDIETTTYISQAFYIGIQYFLLGVSAIYILQNFLLLLGFLPSKNGNYRRDLKAHKKAHIERYSHRQVLIGHSLLCILFTVALYSLNYIYQILPRHTMIWLVFLTFPFLLKFISNARNYTQLKMKN